MDKKKDSKKLKSLEELRFESVGDEYIFLYEVICSSEFAHFITSEESTPTIDYLREIYKDILKNTNLDIKYKDSKRYWFKEQEKAVVDYINCQDVDERNRIFNQHLYKALNKLIENIIFTYKLFRSDIDVKDVQNECMSHLITKIEKFNPRNGAQAFSYLGTIAKHYLMGEKRTMYKITKSNIDIDEHMDEASDKPENKYFLEDAEPVDINLEIFMQVAERLEEDIYKQNKMLPNDRKVAEAIVYLFKNHLLLEAYNKVKIYFLFKERTGLQTKDITYSLGRLKKYYKLLKSNYLSKND